MRVRPTLAIPSEQLALGRSPYVFSRFPSALRVNTLPAGNLQRRMAPWQLDSNSTPTSSSLERR